MPSIVAITQNLNDIGAAISEALSHMPLEQLVKGKLVAVKPNESWASAEDTSGVTQPDTLRAVLRAVKARGPRELVVTGGVARRRPRTSSASPAWIGSSRRRTSSSSTTTGRPLSQSS
jgi:uncharacterized protein (DUF362 family)